MTKNKQITDRSLNILNMAMQAAFFIGFSAITLYSSLYLADLGYKASPIGSLFALANLLAVFIQDRAAKLADENPRWSLKRVTVIELLIPALLFLPLLFFTLPAFYSYLAFLLTFAFDYACQTSMNSINLAYEGAGHAIHFGEVRSCGSIAFASSSVLFGFFFDRYPIRWLIPLLFASKLLTLLFVILLPPVPQLRRKAAEAGPSSSRAFFRKYPLFLPLIIGFSLLFTGHTFLNNFLAWIMESVGGSRSDTGIGAMVGALAELIPMFLYLKLRKKRSDLFWVRLAAVGFTVKIFTLSVAQYRGAVFFSQFLQIAAFGLYISAFSYFASSYVEPEDLSKGQAAVNVVQSFGGAIGNFVGGTAAQRVGIQPALRIMTLLSLIGTVTCLWGTQKGMERVGSAEGEE